MDSSHSDRRAVDAGVTRRNFIGTAAAVPMTALSYSRIVGANDRIQIGQIGCGERAGGLRRTRQQPQQQERRAERGGYQGRGTFLIGIKIKKNPISNEGDAEENTRGGHGGEPPVFVQRILAGADGKHAEWRLTARSGRVYSHYLRGAHAAG